MSTALSGVGLVCLLLLAGALILIRRRKSPKESPVLANAHLVIDVRSAEEFGRAHLSAARNIPLEKIPLSFNDIESWAGGKGSQVVVYCASGMRAGRAERMLRGAGFAHVTNGGGFAKLRSPSNVTSQDRA